ncbi:MAG: tRNA (N6-isopentenyl adenosine(37)-C2)-methylthiotransferase MiaB [Spirochaetales bacterium]|nr:tRNA (N6-isopentenyl adenosine(37)-C2)-methylthiotransferase MiaB [Spirochaetales bacterium]
MRYWLETYGCQMNKAESEALAIELEAAGWTQGGDSTDADLVVLNTCSVRRTAEERLEGRLGHYRHEKERRRFTLAVVGCMSERLKDEFRARFPEIDLVVGTFQKGRFLDALGETLRSHRPLTFADGGEYRFAPLHSRGEFKAFLPVMHGCNNFCSYCIVPYVRGPEVSRPPEEIVRELDELQRRGVREVTLLGQNVNSYAYLNNGTRLDFPGLLDIVADRMSGTGWIRFLTSHPKDCSRALIERLAGTRAFCRHIHLPVQHGSDRILDLMNRGYTRGDYLKLVRDIKNTVSGATITTDILIGFPTETEKDFQDTLDLMREAEFDDAYTYYYNPREGTKACALGDTVSREEKLRRLREIIDLHRDVKRKRQFDRLGRTERVLVEGVSKKNPGELLGRTEHDEMAVFTGPPDAIGTFATVRLRNLQGATFRAEPVQ